MVVPLTMDRVALEDEDSHRDDRSFECAYDQPNQELDMRRGRGACAVRVGLSGPGEEQSRKESEPRESHALPHCRDVHVVLRRQQEGPEVRVVLDEQVRHEEGPPPMLPALRRLPFRERGLHGSLGHEAPALLDGRLRHLLIVRIQEALVYRFDIEPFSDFSAISSNFRRLVLR